MASSISALSYLDPAAYSAVLSSPSSSAASGSGVSATAELQALQQQGNFQGFFNDSLAAAVLQPVAGIDSGAAVTTLVNNMLQQVLGAYQQQSSQTG